MIIWQCVVWIAFYDAHRDLTFNSVMIPIQIQIRIRIGIKPMLIRMWILPKVLHILESKGNFFYFFSQQCQFTCFSFLISGKSVTIFSILEFSRKKSKKIHVLGIDNDPDRPDPNRHAFDADPDPDANPAKLCPFRIRIHKQHCYLANFI
jgi:hypothetical protein